MTITIRPLRASNQYEADATTEAGVRELYVMGGWATVVAAIAAYVESLR